MGTKASHTSVTGPYGKGKAEDCMGDGMRYLRDSHKGGSYDDRVSITKGNRKEPPYTRPTSGVEGPRGPQR